MKALFALALTFVHCVAAMAQILAFEPFQGLTVGSTLTGAGTNSAGWTSAWAGGNDPRYTVLDSAPDLTYQIVGGVLLDGGDRAVQLTTAPEPVPGAGLSATRSIAPQNGTLYISVLVRPIAVGTGTDTIDLRFNDGATTLARMTMKPDLNEQHLNIELPFDGASGGGGGGRHIRRADTTDGDISRGGAYFAPDAFPGED
jgi:hypothetical protein